VDQTGNDAAPFEVDASRAGSGQAHDVLFGPYRNETVATDGNCFCLRILPVEGRNPAVEQNEIGGALLGLTRCFMKAGGQGAESSQHPTAIWAENHGLALLSQGSSPACRPHFFATIGSPPVLAYEDKPMSRI